RVEDVMSRTPVTIPSDYTMEEVADVLLKNEAYGALVVDVNNQIVGFRVPKKISLLENNFWGFDPILKTLF
ncbi:MAG: CBS domain-containing protein, partial [Anaerolineaceae bacterium]|nr:CBS domain-containing protein [Anaerolineaceae bacterium]